MTLFSFTHQSQPERNPSADLSTHSYPSPPLLCLSSAAVSCEDIQRMGIGRNKDSQMKIASSVPHRPPPSIQICGINVKKKEKYWASWVAWWSFVCLFVVALSFCLGHMDGHRRGNKKNSTKRAEETKRLWNVVRLRNVFIFVQHPRPTNAFFPSFASAHY